VALSQNIGEVFDIQRKKLVPVRILIVDDHDVVREGVRSILKKRSDWEIIGEASNGQEAIAQTESLRPDVIILDITMPQMSGLDVARKITQTTPDSRVVMFTMHDSGTVEQAVKGSGAHGLVLKLNAARDLVKAVDTVAGGGTFFSPAVPA
jgi:two-component system nitrate/nitrite response regulator NarL